MGREGLWLFESPEAEFNGPSSKTGRNTRGRRRNEESVERFQNANTVDQDLHMEESRPVPDEQPNTLGSDACELLELSAHIYTQINPCETVLFSDTRTKGKPIKGNLTLFCCHSISFVQGVEKTSGKQIVRAQEQKIKVANSLRGKGEIHTEKDLNR